MATPLWPGYDKTSDDEIVSLLDSTDAAAKDDSDASVDPELVGGLAKAIERHEALKQKQDPDNYREQVHKHALGILEGWKP